MRLIDADKLKEHATKKLARLFGYDAVRVAKAFEGIIDEEPTVDKWVSVNEKLPSKNGKYQTTVNSKINGWCDYRTELYFIKSMM